MGNNGITSKLNNQFLLLVPRDWILFKVNYLLFYLCPFFFLGITTDQNASQVIAAYMMIINLNQKGYNAFAISIPLPSELLAIFELAAPVFVMMMSKV